MLEKEAKKSSFDSKKICRMQEITNDGLPPRRNRARIPGGGITLVENAKGENPPPPTEHSEGEVLKQPHRKLAGDLLR
jgi:hypothetical protein